MLPAQAALELSPLTGVRWRVEGTDSTTLDVAGGLHLTTPLGEITLPLLQAITADGAPVDLAATTPEVGRLDRRMRPNLTPIVTKIGWIEQSQAQKFQSRLDRASRVEALFLYHTPHSSPRQSQNRSLNLKSFLTRGS